MNDLSSYFAMGGHGIYVWSSYAVTAVVLVVLLAATLAGLRRRESELRRLEESHE
ncbi:heme exporter protein CcmD [Oceanibaculum nanhaiense]|uniref:heme exporter protein CcmD n=1 Tax=Oceanibaculum nanhaiense TaxID=1909734 RepID=UPI0025A39A1F|nr:heme exporter protein CcmD [Oceanibaculum nanhaiense]MDM7946897.1 heme exporter protein CcmD [Oceanibaculum nanhaiense]